MKRMVIKLGFRNVFRNYKRTSIILLTIAICTAVIMIIGGIFDYLFNSFEQGTVLNRGHISITSANETTGIKDYKALIKKIESLEGVKLVIPQASASGIIGFEEESSIFDGIGIDSELEKKAESFIYSREIESSKNENGIEVGRILANNIKITKGDIANIFVDNGDNMKGFSLPVNKVVNTAADLLDRVYVSIPLDFLEEKLKEANINLLKVYVEDKDRISSIVSEIKNISLSSDNWNLGSAVFDEKGSELEGAINVYMSNYYFILVVVVFTLLFAVGSTITMSIMERVGELGTVRSFGVEKKNIISMFMFEGCFLGLGGFAIGIIITVIVILITKLTGGIYLPPPPTEDVGSHVFVNFTLSTLILAFCVSVFVSILSSYISTLKVSSLSIIEELRHV